jgi:TonB-dependent starch-binding outer membrane protein SusC
MRKFLLTIFMLSILLPVSWAQDRTITGKVTADDGSTLPGVNVLQKGSTNGTVTDAEGNYRLTLSNSNGVLVFSFIGMATREIIIGQSSVIDVRLELDVKQLAEIVVTGVGVATDKRKLAFAVESIAGDKLPSVPMASIDQALVGKIAGAQILSSSGNPGSQVSIQLRGINTLAGGTAPLIMVDGVQLASTALNSLDLNNVEKVEVVQGASASTIYGAQGANGVIQIFTKRGKAGPMKIDASMRISTDQFLNVSDLGQARNHSFTTNANGDIVDTNGNLLSQDRGFWGQVNWENGATAKNDKPYKNNTQFYDHVNQLFKQANTTNYSIALSGGKENSDYSFTYSRLKQESVIQGALDRDNFTSNIGVEIAKGLKLRSVTQLIYSNSTVNPTGNGNTGTAISSAFYTWPFADFTYKDSDGNYLYKFGGAGTNSSNPLYINQYQQYSNSVLDVIPSLNLHFAAKKIFELDYKLGANYSVGAFARETQNQTQASSYLYNSSYYTTIPIGQLAQTKTENYNINSLVTATATIDFTKDLGWQLPFTSTTQVAFDWRKSNFNRLYSNFTGLPAYYPIGKVNGAQASSGASTEYEDTFITFGYLVNQRFDYKDIAGFSGGFRSDYSSTYGDAKSPFTFPRGDAFVRLSKLNFWDKLSGVVPEFKLRAAYGEAGIQPVGYLGTFAGFSNLVSPAPYHYQRATTFNTGIVDQGAYFYAPSGIANANLKVEQSKEFEYGVDIGVAPNKEGKLFNYISGNFSIWQRKTIGAIWNRTLPVSSGAESIIDNYIDLRSEGFQFSIDADIYTSNNFKWDLITNFGQTKTFIDRTADGKDIPLVYTNAATFTLKPGEQVGSIYGYKALSSVDQKDKQGSFYLDQTAATNYEKVNGFIVEKSSKKVQFSNDKYALGNTVPDFNMTFINNFSYKDYLTLSVQVDWVAGAKVYNQTKEWMYSEGLHKDYDKPLTINGETGAWTAYYKSFYDATESNGTKDYFLENASFARLRNLTLGFDFAKFFQWQKINRLQLVFTGRNLATITNYSGFDPESNQNTSGGGTGSAAPQSAVQRGLDFWSFPNFKSYQVGLTISF